jgi:hypothetical protein
MTPDVMSLIACHVCFQNGGRKSETQMAAQPSYPGAPRWLKVSAIAIGGVALLLIVLIHAGGGLRHHMPSIDGFGHSAAQGGGR